MSKLVQSLCILLGLSTVVGISILYLSHKRQHNEVQEDQLELLNTSFIKVRSQKGNVLLVPRQGNMIDCSNPGTFHKASVFPVGFTFKAYDEHGAGTYHIASIKHDGVVIHFDASGSHPGPFPTSKGSFNSSGYLKLIWK